MSKTTTNQLNIPATDSLDPEVLAFRQAFDGRSPLDEIIHEGARRMLQAAIDAEVDAFIETHQDRRDSDGRRLVVKNGSLPAREILTGAGALQVQQGRVRDNSPGFADRVQFSPSVLPAYLRRTESIEELIPWPPSSVNSASKEFLRMIILEKPCKLWLARKPRGSAPT